MPIPSAGLAARLYTELTAHTLCVWLNRLLGVPDLLHLKSLACPTHSDSYSIHFKFGRWGKPPGFGIGCGSRAPVRCPVPVELSSRRAEHRWSLSGGPAHRGLSLMEAAGDHERTDTPAALACSFQRCSFTPTTRSHAASKSSDPPGIMIQGNRWAAKSGARKVANVLIR
jgi:hypothetical protein